MSIHDLTDDGDSKRSPLSPGGKAEPVGTEVESARLLANDAREELTSNGLTDERVDELADEFVATDVGTGIESFIHWALERTQAERGY